MPVSVLPWMGTPSMRDFDAEDVAHGMLEGEIVGGIADVEQRAVDVEQIGVGAGPEERRGRGGFHKFHRRLPASSATAAF
jgi:hypothetical protein